SESSVFSVEQVGSRAQLESAVRSGRAQVAIEIPADYTSTALYQKTSTVHVWIDGSNPAMADYMLLASDAMGLQQSLERTAAHYLPIHSIADVQVRPHIVFNVDGRTAAFLIPGLVAVLVQMVSTLLTAISVVTERENGTLDQMLTTPLTPAAILAGKLIACACVGFVEGCLVLVLMRWVFAVPIAGSLPLLGLALLLVLLPSVGLGLVITSGARHQAQALQFTYLIFLPSVLISGFLFPRQFMPAPMFWLSKALPTTYFVDLMRAIVIRGSGIIDVAADIGMILLIGVTILSVALLVFVKRLHRA